MTIRNGRRNHERMSEVLRLCKPWPVDEDFLSCAIYCSKAVFFIFYFLFISLLFIRFCIVIYLYTHLGGS